MSQIRLTMLSKKKSKKKSESLSKTPFPIARRVSLYLELISGRCGDRTSIIVMVALCANHYSTRAEIFDKLRGRYQFPKIEYHILIQFTIYLYDCLKMTSTYLFKHVLNLVTILRNSKLSVIIEELHVIVTVLK